MNHPTFKVSKDRETVEVDGLTYVLKPVIVNKDDLLTKR